ncbi:MAG: type II toxin-antitoxin system PemK/MazF family toxin [Proteobacteria bacterium]|nr:type II toxin-antitoxin system PemK/MazF family toxin [Pseudomonadota bacterium]
MISIHPHAGTLLMCDFVGFREPEMTKKRPIVVITPRLQYRNDLCTIVPLSLSEPLHPQPYHYKLSRNYNPLEVPELPVWAKCDMLVNIGIWRLEGFKVGRRKWEIPKVSAEDLAGIKAGVLAALGYP